VRRFALVALAAIAVLIVRVGFGVGWAASVHGTPGPDVLGGTAKADRLFGRGGADRLDGLAGPDFLDGGPGPDVLDAGRGDDLVSAEEDGARDRIACGPGRDVVTLEAIDRADASCEVASVQLSRDRTFARGAQHRTAVEPASFASGRTVVAAFQLGRIGGGGAGAIGFSTSRDAGRTWRSGVLPGITEGSPRPGASMRAADPSVVFDPVHRWWLVASLADDFGGTSILVSRSRDGLEWSAPIVAAGREAGDADKEWLVCDGSRTSRFRGRCYVSYLNLTTEQIETRFTLDGGRTWSAPAATAPSTLTSIVNGALPVTRPDGSLVVLFSAFSGVLDPAQNSILAVRSTDGGVTFGPVTRVTPLYEEDVRGMRAPPLPSATVDRAGTVYVAWADCRFRPECAAQDVVVATSRDGRTWSGPRRVPAVAPGEDAPEVFLPAIAVDPSSTAGSPRVAVVYHTLPQEAGCAFDACPGVDVWLQRSADGGAHWGRPQRLSARSMPLGWIADGDTGAMLGDYISVSWAGGRPVPVFALALTPDGRRAQAGDLRDGSAKVEPLGRVAQRESTRFTREGSLVRSQPRPLRRRRRAPAGASPPEPECRPSVVESP
jgi:hypothetical protein